jgi:cell filamentation protein
MYEAVADPVCYTNSNVLRNIPDLRSQAALDRFEAAATGRRFMEPLPTGRLSVRHYQAVHHHIFQDVYRWAGRSRRVRIGKGSSMFCYPENIQRELVRVFAHLRLRNYLRELGRREFATGAAHFIAELNAVHPFRDGNGRSQLAFLALVAAKAGHALNLEILDPSAFLIAMIASFHGEEGPLVDQIQDLIG